LIIKTSGIGLGLLTKYVSRPNTVVIAAVRDPSNSSSKALSSVSTGNNSKVIVSKIDSYSLADTKNAVETLKTKHGISHLDIVIANAGVSKTYATATKIPLEEAQYHFEANTFGPMLLFQAVLPLLEAAPRPKFVIVSSVFASMGDMDKHQFP
jgi:norsolorinic acid ketoreductase